MFFLKAQALGNDFVILEQSKAITTPFIISLSNRRTGIGFDQLIVVDSFDEKKPSIHFYNADGSESKACGNGTRCVAKFLMEHQKRNTIEFKAGDRTLVTSLNENGLISVNLGRPFFQWDQIPLSQPLNTQSLPLQLKTEAGFLKDPIAVNVGNPHLIFFVDALASYDIEDVGPVFENHPLFPERINVSLASIMSSDTINLTVWERGAGYTYGCGTAACAAAVAAIRQCLTKDRVTIRQLGGDLTITWQGLDIWMEGPANLLYEGKLLPHMI